MKGGNQVTFHRDWTPEGWDEEWTPPLFPWAPGEMTWRSLASRLVAAMPGIKLLARPDNGGNGKDGNGAGWFNLAPVQVPL